MYMGWYGVVVADLLGWYGVVWGVQFMFSIRHTSYVECLGLVARLGRPGVHARRTCPLRPTARIQTRHLVGELTLPQMEGIEAL